MSMKFPEFHSDQEMADWFETNDVSSSDLEIANDVVISSNLTVRLVSHGFANFYLPSSATGANTLVGDVKSRNIPVLS